MVYAIAVERAVKVHFDLLRVSETDNLTIRLLSVTEKIMVTLLADVVAVIVCVLTTNIFIEAIRAEVVTLLLAELDGFRRVLLVLNLVHVDRRLNPVRLSICKEFNPILCHSYRIKKT